MRRMLLWRIAVGMRGGTDQITFGILLNSRRTASLKFSKGTTAEKTQFASHVTARFANDDLSLVQFTEMSLPPFHGIFSGSIDTPGSIGKKRQSRAQEPKLTDEPVFEAEPQHAIHSEVGQVALDIFEYDNYYIIKAPMAGVRLSEIDIEITDNVLTIKGERKQTDTIADNQYYLRECFWGPFSRSVTLPMQIDPRKVKATFNKESILKILIPKEEKVKIVRVSES